MSPFHPLRASRQIAMALNSTVKPTSAAADMDAGMNWNFCTPAACMASWPTWNWGQSGVCQCMDCGNGFRAAGKLVAAEALQPIATAKTVRVRQGAVRVVDGPFAETKELLAGF